jgi:hypothetical protein
METAETMSAVAAAKLAERLADYRKLLARIDWAYQFSDDHSVVKRNEVLVQRAEREQKLIDPDKVIWNEVQEARNARLV